ncbi:MAG: ferredoxin family protein, partial [Planctomycetaceae bacterium]|nr:ferredoxin family protein [Planctomycetaceae bacterium]
MKKLPHVIEIDHTKCVNCNKCIRECPVHFCNNGATEDEETHKGHIGLNTDMCIGCGACIRACAHGARVILDDTDTFMTDLRRGVKMVAVVAPAVAVSFPNKYFHLNT